MRTNNYLMNDKKQVEIDDLDLEILEIISTDGRENKSEIAKKLSRSPNTIKKHINNLEKEEIITSYGASIDYEKLGYDFIALIELTISKGEMLRVEEEIANNPNVFAVYDITGTYDAVILARFKSRTELNKFVKKLNSSEFVVRTNTHLVLNVIKEGTNLAELIKK